METDRFLQQLRMLSLEEGRRLVAEYALTLDDYAAFGVLLADEALDQSYANPTISLKLAELLIFFGEQFMHPSSRALGLKAKGDMLKTIGLHRAALACLDEAGAEFLRLGDEGNWARSRISWIISCNWLGETEKALQEANLAHDTFIRLGEPYWACVIAHNMAVIYEDMGRYEEALQLYHYTITTYPTLTELDEHVIKRVIAITQSNQANDLALLGHLDDAYRLQQEARASFIDLGDTSCVIKTEVYLADLDYTHGYYASTLRHYYDALDLMKRDAIDEPPLLASLKLCMARCYLKLDRVQEACQAAEEAVAIQQQLGVSLETSNALSEYAVTLIAAGKLQEALAAFAEAITLFKKEGGLDYHIAITKLRQAELLLEMGRATEAYEQAALLKKEFEAQTLISRSVHAGLIMMGALRAIARPEEVQQAITLGKRVAALARRHHLHEDAYKSHYLLGQLFDLQKDVPRATKHYAAAISQIERVLDHLVYDFSPAFLRTTWSIYEEMIEHCLQQSQFGLAFGYLERARSMALRQHLYRTRVSQKKGGEPTSSGNDSASVLQTNNATILRLQKELADWQEQYRTYSMLLADPAPLTSFSLDLSAVEQELKRCEAKVSELYERLHLYQSTIAGSSQRKRGAITSPYRLDIARLQKQLGPDECLLAYFMYRGKLVIFVLTDEELIIREYPGEAERLEQLLPILYAHLSPEGWPDIHNPPQGMILRLLQKLYKILLAPLSSISTSHIKSLVIVPYGPLHDLPFQALNDGTQFLIERFQVSYLPASSLMIDLNHAYRGSPRRSVLPTKPTSAILFGYAGNGRMQRTLDEANTLALALNGRCYLEQEATIARLFAEATGSPIIHIATHGRVRLDAPHFSSVLLADGQFNAIDAFQLDLKACHLVTLSGCDTGKALTGGGDEQLGLGRAFLAAGARSLVMSLWPVEDQATTLLMQQFYQHLLAGETKAEALRAAQCHFLHHAPPMYSHPYFWAAFRLVGDTGALPPSIRNQPSASPKYHRERHVPKTRISSVP